jgi:putative membrane protein insertion efficiency factor
MKTVLVWLIRMYQRGISPILGQHCRFSPTCSQYMIDAINAKGLFKGLCLGIWRICRCNPFNPGGYDPVK